MESIPPEFLDEARVYDAWSRNRNFQPQSMGPMVDAWIGLGKSPGEPSAGSELRNDWFSRPKAERQKIIEAYDKLRLGRSSVMQAEDARHAESMKKHGMSEWEYVRRAIENNLKDSVKEKGSSAWREPPGPYAPGTYLWDGQKWSPSQGAKPQEAYVPGFLSKLKNLLEEMSGRASGNWKPTSSGGGGGPMIPVRGQMGGPAGMQMLKDYRSGSPGPNRIKILE